MELSTNLASQSPPPAPTQTRRSPAAAAAAAAALPPAPPVEEPTQPQGAAPQQSDPADLKIQTTHSISSLSSAYVHAGIEAEAEAALDSATAADAAPTAAA